VRVVNVSAMIVLGFAGAVLANTRKEEGDSGGMPHGGTNGRPAQPSRRWVRPGPKSESGGDIFAHGGATFVQALSRLGLIDEYRLIIHPVALGNGLPLFKDLARPLRLDLAEARSFPGGTVIHVYRPIRTTG
jgi:hypothetical protein